MLEDGIGEVGDAYFDDIVVIDPHSRTDINNICKDYYIKKINENLNQDTNQ